MKFIEFHSIKVYNLVVFSKYFVVFILHGRGGETHSC